MWVIVFMNELLNCMSIEKCGVIDRFMMHLTCFFLHCNCRAQLFDLAVSLLPGLDAKEIDLLFVAIKPALRVCHSLYIGLFCVFVCVCNTVELRPKCS